jgi:hypothetical protein
VKPPFRPTRRFVVAIRRGGRRFSFLVSSEAPTNLNSDRGKKLREYEWLISAILREINHLEGERLKQYLIQSLILSTAGTSRTEVPSESNDPCTLPFSGGCNDLGVRSGRQLR